MENHANEISRPLAPPPQRDLLYSQAIDSVKRAPLDLDIARTKKLRRSLNRNETGEESTYEDIEDFNSVTSVIITPVEYASLMDKLFQTFISTSILSFT